MVSFMPQLNREWDDDSRVLAFIRGPLRDTVCAVGGKGGDLIQWFSPIHGADDHLRRSAAGSDVRLRTWCPVGPPYAGRWSRQGRQA